MQAADVPPVRGAIGRLAAGGAIVALILSLGIASGSWARSDSGEPVPLHWQIGFIDSIGTIPSDQFVFLPSDLVRPGPRRTERVHAPFIATLDSAIASGLVFRQTAFLLATEYSRAQQEDFATALRLLTGRPEVIGSLREDWRTFVGMLGGHRDYRYQDTEPVRIALLTTRQTRTLDELPLSACFELGVAATDSSPDHGIPRMMFSDLGELIAHATGNNLLRPSSKESAALCAALADTLLPLATRLELSRGLSLVESEVVSKTPGNRVADSLRAAVEARVPALVRRARRGELPKSRYHWLDEPLPPNAPVR